jgi:hypothetical protein
VEESFNVESTSTSNPGDFQDGEATAGRASAAIGIIASALDALGQAGSLSRTEVVPERVFRIAYGWFAAVVRSSQLVALAHENGLGHACAATSRVVLQHTLALQWLIEGGDPAADAVEADGLRRAFDLVRN